MSTVRFAVARMNFNDKSGILKPDQYGYRNMCVGALGMRNSGGALYVRKESEDLFKKSSSFMRRTQSGYLFGEYGHPKKHPAEDMRAFMKRVMYPEEKNIAVHHSDFTLDDDYNKIPNMPKGAVAIISRLKPAGPYGPTLETDLSNGFQNSAFSIRTLSKDVNVGGEIGRVLTVPITFDYVTEPGLPIANKWDSPNMEAFVDPFEQYISESVLRGIAEESLSSIISTESSKILAEEILRELPRNPDRRPVYFNWQ